MAIPLSLSEVPAATPYVQYVATNGQTVFPYPFPITQDSDLIVVYNGVTLATDAGYTLSGQGNDTGGNVTFTADATAGDIVTLYRDIAIERLTQIGQNSGFASSAFNAEFNNLYLICQQLEASIGQCLQIPNTNNPAPTVALTPSAYAGKYLSFDSNGNPTPAVLTPSGSITGPIIAALLNLVTGTAPTADTVRTAAEISQGIIPTNYAYAPYTLLRYGADPTGVADSTTALQHAINCAQAAGNAMVRVGVPGAKFLVGGSWTIDLNTTGIDFEGAQVSSGAAFQSGNWLAPTQSLADVNERAGFNSAHPIKNATFIGAGSGYPATCVYLNDTASTPTIDGLSFQNINFMDWGNDVTFNNGAFSNSFLNCTFSVKVGGGTGPDNPYSIVNNSGTTNAGERNTFINCAWYNKEYYINQHNALSDIYLLGCSLDGHIRAVNCDNGGSVFLVGCHIESATDTDYWLYCTGVNSKILVRSSEFVVDVNKIAFSLAYSDATCTWGGVYMDGISVGASSGYAVHLIAGSGNAIARDIIGEGSAAGQPSIYALAMNQFADPIFASGAFTGDAWTASGSTAPTVESTKPYSGSNDVKFTNSGGTSTLTSRVIPCAPGQQACVDIFACFPTFTASAQFTATAKYVNAAGSALTSVVGGTTGAGFTFMDISAQVSSYTEYSSNASGGLGRAPAGTAGVVLVLTMGGGSGGTAFLGQAQVTVG